jgi:recombinational DNA repair protein RecT
LGYRGVIALAQRSGEVLRIQADVVRDKDYFKYSKGLHPILEHEESPDEDRGNITHVYAVANFKNNGFAFEVWPAAKVVAHAKKFSKSYYKDEFKNGKRTGEKIIDEKSPWYTDFESMAKKTLIMAIWKYLPVSTEFMLAAATDESVKDDIGGIRDEKDIITISSSSMPLEGGTEGGAVELEESHPKGIAAPRSEIPVQKQPQPESSDFPLPEPAPQDETKDAVSKLNAELDARDGVNSPNLF